MTKDELKQKRIASISLGCDKNRVDLEKMLCSLKDYGFQISSDIYESDIVIVNTCAFIQPAREEAINNICLAIKLKEEHLIEKVIVSGCFPQKNLEELQQGFPEVDSFVMVKSNPTITSVIEKMYGIKDSKFIIKPYKRLLTDVSHYAFLKIADGCSNACAYCTIPRIRGRYKSIPIDDVIDEAEYLAELGAKELIIVAQDVSKYGTDIYEKNMLLPLLEKLIKIKKIKWIRLLYCYPEDINDELLAFIIDQPKVCNYIDIPLQHIDNEILRKMNRRNSEDGTIDLIKHIHNNYSDITIRSTFIVGLPTEKKKEFKKLCNFIKMSKLDNVGFFAYSREENTKAGFMKEQVPEFIKKLRLKKIQSIQEKIALCNNLDRIGQTVEVLIDYFDQNTGEFVGHDQYNTPDVDFSIRIADNNNIVIGQFYNVLLTSYNNYDFIGEVQE